MIDGKKPKLRDVCCYLAGEVNCTNSDCLLVGIAMLMFGFIIGGIIFTL